MKRVPFLIWVICSSLLLFGCKHKDLIYGEDLPSGLYNPVIELKFISEWENSHTAGLNWKEEWADSFGVAYDELRPKLPEGVRARVYRPDGQVDLFNFPISGGVLHLYEPQDYSLIFYNNDTEYIIFNDLEDYVSAHATTRSRMRPSYKGNTVLSKGGTKTEETTVGPPDMLYGSYIDSYNPEKVPLNDTLSVTMHPLVFIYLVRYEFSHGLQYVAGTKGALAGMAKSVYLTTGKTGKDEATILYDCELKDFGSQALVRSFGIPDFPNPDYTRGPQKFGLTLEVTLKNGLQKNFDFDVTDQLVKQPHGGVIIVRGIEVPDEAGESGGVGGGGGFDVDVDGWGDFEDIEIDM